MADTLPHPPSLRDAEWLNRDATRKLFAVLNAHGHTARAVGGAVRNALLGEPVHDIDIATTSPPDVTRDLAQRAGLKAVDTGIDHGTITVIVDHTPFEVTTLRTDVATFGRHARVAFTDDWAADAQRRDFTLNALYCDADGTVHDPLCGYVDLVARRVRFIGDARERIREDTLRILRFFRFSAEYADGALDPTGLQACIDLREGLDSLSRERVRAELLRLLTARDAVKVLPRIAEDFLSRLLPDPPDVALVKRLIEREAALELPADAVRRLGALSGARPGGATALKEALRLSSREFERVARLSLPDPAFDPETDEATAKAALYRHGPDAFVDGVLLQWARSDASAADTAFQHRITLPKRWNAPAFPIRGSDVVDLGVKVGPDVGTVLAEFEDWWIAADFPADPAVLAAQLADIAAQAKTKG